MSKQTYTLTKHDTVAYVADHEVDGTEHGPFSIKLFQRADADTIVGVLTLNTTFDEAWQAAMQRKGILAAGKITLANWNGGPQFELAPF